MPTLVVWALWWIPTALVLATGSYSAATQRLADATRTTDRTHSA